MEDNLCSDSKSFATEHFHSIRCRSSFRCPKRNNCSARLNWDMTIDDAFFDRDGVSALFYAVSANRVTKKYCRPISMALTHGICPETIVVFPSVQSTVGIVV